MTESSRSIPRPSEGAQEMTQREEAAKVYRNLKADHWQIAHYIVERCGDFMGDHQREKFIAEFLRAASGKDAVAIAAERELIDDLQALEGDCGRDDILIQWDTWRVWVADVAHKAAVALRGRGAATRGSEEPR